jgi:peptide-methionine (S)-S-oxide reductase
MILKLFLLRIVNVFLLAGSHNTNQQGPDRGSSYRSIAFYRNAAEKKTIEDKIKELTTIKFLILLLQR